MTDQFENACHHCGRDAGEAYWSDERFERHALNFGLVLDAACAAQLAVLTDADYTAAGEAWQARLAREAEARMPTAANVADALQGAIEPALFARYLQEHGDAEPCDITARGKVVTLTVCRAVYDVTVTRRTPASAHYWRKQSAAEASAKSAVTDRLRELAFRQCVDMAVQGIRVDLKAHGHQVPTAQQVRRAAMVQARTTDPAVLDPLVAAITAWFTAWSAQ